MELKDLEKALTALISDLKPAPGVPEDAAVPEIIAFDGTEKSNDKWLGYISEALKTAKTFEIHCWNEEVACIELALRYGKLKADDWQHGKIIAGQVIPAFAEILMGLPKPTDVDVYNKMTPFFTIAFDNGFWSEHYGTELIIQPRADVFINTTDEAEKLL